MDIIFKGIVGSRAYGLNDENSDTDIKGVYQQTNDEVLGFQYKERIDVSADEVYYEVRKFIELIGKSNPTILEMLWLPDSMILQTSEAFEFIKNSKHSFLSKECKNSYIGYAQAQIKKAKINHNSKNLMHVFRLIMSAEQIVKNLTIPVLLNSDQIILCKEIKQNIIDFDDAILLAEEKINYISDLFDKSLLKEKIDQNYLHDLLVKIRKMKK